MQALKRLLLDTLYPEQARYRNTERLLTGRPHRRHRFCCASRKHGRIWEATA